MRFVVGDIWQSIDVATMRAEVIEVDKKGYEATLRYAGKAGTFRLNRLLALSGQHRWRPLQEA